MRATKGMLIASAAASLILGRAIAARADEGKTGGEMVHCAGINACKGQGECSGAGHSCGGKNACKGQGWVETSKAECAKKGGKIAGEEKK